MSTPFESFAQEVGQDMRQVAQQLGLLSGRFVQRVEILTDEHPAVMPSSKSVVRVANLELDDRLKNKPLLILIVNYPYVTAPRVHVYIPRAPAANGGHITHAGDHFAVGRKYPVVLFMMDIS